MRFKARVILEWEYDPDPRDYTFALSPKAMAAIDKELYLEEVNELTGLLGEMYPKEVSVEVLEV